METMRIKGQRQVAWTEEQKAPIGPRENWVRPAMSDSTTIFCTSLSGTPTGSGTSADPVSTISAAMALCVSESLSQICIMDSETYKERIDNDSLSAITIIAAEGCIPKIVQPDPEITVLSTSGLGNADIHCIIVDSDGVLWAGSDSGIVYKSTDKGLAWSSTNTGSGVAVYCLALYKGVVYAGSLAGLYSYSGTAWNNVGTFDGNGRPRSMAVHDDFLIIGTDDASAEQEHYQLYIYNGSIIKPMEGLAAVDGVYNTGLVYSVSSNYAAGSLLLSGSDTEKRGIWYIIEQTGGYYIPSLALSLASATSLKVFELGSYVWVVNGSEIRFAYIGGTKWISIPELNGVVDMFMALGEVYAITGTALYKWTGSLWRAVAGTTTAITCAVVISSRIILAGESGEVMVVKLTHSDIPVVMYGSKWSGWGLISSGNNLEYRSGEFTGYTQLQFGGEALLSGAVVHDTGQINVSNSLTILNTLVHHVTGGFQLNGDTAQSLTVNHATIVDGDIGVKISGEGNLTSLIENSIFDCSLDIQTGLPIKIVNSRLRFIDGEMDNDSSGVISDIPHYRNKDGLDYRLRSLSSGFRYDSPLLDSINEDKGAYYHERSVTGISYGTDYTVNDNPDKVSEQAKLPGAGGSDGVDGSFFAWSGAERPARATEYRWNAESISSVEQMNRLQKIWASCLCYIVGLVDDAGNWVLEGPQYSVEEYGTTHSNGLTTIAIYTGSNGDLFGENEYYGLLLFHETIGVFRIKSNIASGDGDYVGVTVYDPGAVLAATGGSGPFHILTGSRDPRLIRFDPKQSFEIAGPSSGAWHLAGQDHRGGCKLIAKEVWIHD